MVDYSNMGHNEIMFYQQLEAMGIVITGKLRRLPEMLPSGAIKEWVVTLKYPDETVKHITVPWDLDN